MTLALRATTPTTAAEPTRTWSGRRRQAGQAATVVTTPQPVELTWANRRPGSPGFARWATHLGHEIDQHGLVATAPAVDALVALAAKHGVAPVAARVLADPAEPEPARLRAFACVVQALVAPR